MRINKIIICWSVHWDDNQRRFFAAFNSRDYNLSLILFLGLGWSMCFYGNRYASIYPIFMVYFIIVGNTSELCVLLLSHVSLTTTSSGFRVSMAFHIISFLLLILWVLTIIVVSLFAGFDTFFSRLCQTELTGVDVHCGGAGGSTWSSDST
jgi:hypothetical protein